MNKAVKDFHARDRAVTRTLLPLVAIGGGLAVTPATALELGELSVQSNLGQPLRASIAYALAPNEMLSDTCVSIGGGRSTGGLPGIGRSSVRITEQAILVTGESVVREPMLGTRVTIKCPYTPNISREYMLFVDPANPAQASQVASPAAPATVATVTAPPVATRAARPSVERAPIELATRIQVQPGDSLGEIASRIEDRPIGLWPAVNAIFAANPDAFIDNDPNKLKAGSWLAIPNFDGTAAVVSAAAPTEAATASAVDTADGGVYEPPVLEEIAEPPVEATAATESTSELRPGDVILDSANPYVVPAVVPAAATTETVIIPDTQLPGPETASTSPNVPTASAKTEIVSTGSRSESTSLYTWLIGGGLAIIAALLLFGRRVRNRFGSTPIGAAASATPAHDDAETVEALAAYEIDDDSPTEENLALDADLVLGTGLTEGTDMDVAQDFGFAATTELDIELPFEPQEPVTDSETDIIPAPSSAKMESILESEVLPEDDDYDMSVIMDATKMPHPEDVTERDLMAVPVGSADETLISDNYTISKEVDYDILEQDYQEEMTATQALNEEISRAAAALSRNLDETVSEDETSEMPLATVTEIDVTAQLPTQEEETAEMERARDPNDTAAVTVNLPTDDETAEMPVANDDDTTEMEIEGGRIDTKNS